MRRNRYKYLLVLPVVWGLFFPHCRGSGGETEMGKPHLTVSVQPQAYFVRKIAGDGFRINVLIPPGHSPATYAPTPKKLESVARSVLYFRIGHIAFEKAWMENISALNRKMKIVDTSEGVGLIYGNHRHSHRGEPAHHVPPGGKEDSPHAGADPHIWLSPRAVKIQAGNILAALVETDAENRRLYEKNYRDFSGEIDRLDREIRQILDGLEGKSFMVFHPAWSYFARDYGLVQLPIEIEGKAPHPADLKSVIDAARNEGIKTIFVQRQFDTHSAGAVARELGVRVVPLDPLGANWPANLKEIARNLKEALTD